MTWNHRRLRRFNSLIWTLLISTKPNLIWILLCMNNYNEHLCCEFIFVSFSLLFTYMCYCFLSFFDHYWSWTYSAYKSCSMALNMVYLTFAVISEPYIGFSWSVLLALKSSYSLKKWTLSCISLFEAQNQRLWVKQTFHSYWEATGSHYLWVNIALCASVWVRAVRMSVGQRSSFTTDISVKQGVRLDLVNLTNMSASCVSFLCHEGEMCLFWQV